MSLSLSVYQYLVIFGGFNEFDDTEKCFSDLHYIDITAPSGKNDNYLLIAMLCSCSYTTMSRNTRITLSNSGSFSWRSATPPGSSKPAERYGHSAVIYNKALYIMIGQNSDHDFNDVWRVEMKGMYVC